MLRHVYARTLAATAALSSALTLGLVALSPAPATAAAPACIPGYPANVPTTTSVRLTRTLGRYGSTNVATVRVRSGVGRPTGTVTLRVGGVATYRLALHGGNATRTLPRNLEARHTYTVSARYGGQGCFMGSSASSFYTVVRAQGRISGLHAANIRRGGHPRVTGRVTTTTGRAETGSVSVKLYFHHRLVRQTTVRLHGGHFAASFGRVRSTGTWTVKATKPSNRDYKGDSATTHFRVRS